jgi:hypothetical protein
MMIGRRLLLATLAIGGIAGAAGAQVVTHDVFYTRYGLDNPATEYNVKKVSVSYDRTTHALSFGPLVNIAQTAGADGIVFAPDGDLLVGGQSHNNLFKLNRVTGVGGAQPTGGAGGYHVKLDPSGLKAWVADNPGMLAEVPLNPFAPGTTHALTGDDLTVTDIAWAGGRVFYTSSGDSGHGNFGIIDLTTFHTTRILADMPSPHGMQFDAFTGYLLLFGQHQIAQVDPAPAVPTVVSVLDLTAQYPTLQFDQGATDGTGLIYIASSRGQLVAMDVAGGSHLVADAASTVAVEFLENYLDDIAPLIGPGVNPCCPIGSGSFDFRSAQQSQLPGVSTVPFDYRVADDFYLLPGRMYHINSIEGTLITDSIFPKARLELYNDCNGLPADPYFRVEPQATSIVDTGSTFEGKRVLRVRFDFTDLWLRGGESYWVSFIGQGLGSPDETWYWGTAGNGQSSGIKGRPGAFKSVIGGVPQWTPIDGHGCPSCIGCTDFAFCVDAESCKILTDNGTYAPQGTISLDGPGGTFARTADDFVVPPCVPQRLCYIEAYIASNCDQARLAIYNNACDVHSSTQGIAGGAHPDGFTPFATLIPDQVIQTGRTAVIGNLTLPIVCLRFWTFNLTLPPGDYWLSAYGLSTGNAAQRAYFLFNQDCNRSCLIRWNEGNIYGPSVQPAPNTWVRGSSLFGVPHDYSWLIAVHDAPVTFAGAGNGQTGCAVDFDGNGVLSVQDVFDYMAAWFAGCP